MKKNLFFLLFIIIVLFSCKKEDTINDIFGWKNTNSSASGLRNGKKWEASRVRMFALNDNVFLDFFEYDQDSVLISFLSIANIPPYKGTYKLNQHFTLSNEVYSFFDYGYADIFSTYKPDTLQNNTIQITEFNLESGVIKGKINATYLHIYGQSNEFVDTAQFKNLEFTYLK